MDNNRIDKAVANFFKYWLGPIMLGIIILVSVIVGIAYADLNNRTDKSAIDFVDASGSIIGATLGSFFAFLSIFFVVYSLQYQTNEKKRDQEELDKNRLIYFYSLLNQSVAFLKATITSLRNRKKAYEDDPKNFHGGTFGVVNSLYRISNVINQEEYYLAYKKAFNDETINSIFNNIDAIDFNFKVLKSDIQMEQNLYNKRKDELNEYIKELSFLIINISQGKLRYLSDSELKKDTALFKSVEEYYGVIDSYMLDLVNLLNTNDKDAIPKTATEKYSDIHAFFEELHSVIGKYKNEDYSNSLGKIEKLKEDWLNAKTLYSKIDSGAATVLQKIDEALKEYRDFLNQIRRYIESYESRYFKKYGDNIDK
jgi:hypothetical protein